MRLRTALLASVPAIAALGLMLPADAAPAKTAKLENLPYSGSVLVARAIRAGTIHLANGHATAQQPGVLPKKKVLKDVDADAGTTQAVDETPIAANPLNPKQLITGGNDYACSSVRGFWTSNDGGKTWSGACAKDESGSTSGGGDPVVGYDLNGTVYQGGIDFLSNGDWAVSVASSTNNGQTWNAPVQAVQLGTDLADKPWLEIDTNANSSHKNNLYISNTMFGAGSSTTIYVTTSTDGGKTWKSVAASPTNNLPNIYQFSDLAIGSDGTVYLSYMNCPGNGPNGNCADTLSTMYFQKSTDGGQTWSKQVAIGNFMLTPNSSCGNYYGSVPNSCDRLSNVAALGVDNSGGTRTGQLYLSAYNWNGTNSIVEVTTSTNGGSSWSTPVPVGDSKAKNDQFFPWLSVDSKGNVGVSWFDRRNDTSNVNYEEFGAKSTNGGGSFGTNYQLASQPSNPSNDGVCGCFIGDYSGNIFAGKTLHASWTDTRNGSYSQDYVGGLK